MQSLFKNQRLPAKMAWTLPRGIHNSTALMWSHINVFSMIQFTRKISAVTFACLLAFNIAASAAPVAEHCLSSMGSSPMDMHHCDGLLNFSFPTINCCGECNDIFCDLMKNPFQDANAVNSSPSPGSIYPIFPATVDPIAEPGAWTAMFEPRYLFSASLARSQIPLYIEHLSLII